MKKKGIFMIKMLLGLGIAVLAAVIGFSTYIKAVTKDKLQSVEEAAQKKEKPDCILVLGAKVRPSGQPSKMLRDRMDKGIELYKAGAAPKIIMSGDHGREDYDEVNLMKQYAIDAGVPSEDIFMDHAGFATYDSMYRGKYVFGVERMIIVTQKYHVYRSIYIAEQLGIEATGVVAKEERYFGQTKRDIREWLARDKDFFKCMVKPESTYVGDVIDIHGNGNVTNDK